MGRWDKYRQGRIDMLDVCVGIMKEWKRIVFWNAFVQR